MAKASALWGTAFAALALSCSAVIGIDGLVADRTTDAAPPESGVPEGGSFEGGGPTRVSFGAFSMDPTEVTAGAYKAFLDTNPSVTDQREDCAWNDSYQPGYISAVAVAATIDAGYPPPGPECNGWLDAHPNPKVPIVCIDWCDAVAYCAWAGGHLCEGTDGRSLTYQNDTMPARGEWWTACSTNGANVYPYGNTYAYGRCNDLKTKVDEVKRYPDCQVNGVFDLSGNASEWEDSCSAYDDPPVGQNCLTRGGAFFDDDAGLTCIAYREKMRGSQSPSDGFRCCGR